MKKLREKIATTPSTNSSSSSGQNSLIGKSFSLSKYTVSVDEIIAEGGFGIVYLAHQSSQKYALKRILVNNEHDLDVASKEIQFMTQLNHPNILECIDYSLTSLGGSITEILMLMPFVKGSLLALLNSKMSSKSHLSEGEVLDLLVDLVGAVARLHQCTTPIIHRDLKIENVLEEDGRYILCDFGSATAKIWDPLVHGPLATLEDLEKYTTLAYRSPEMVDPYSNRGPITTKADIWALGVLLYKVCFYTTPFGDSVLAIQSCNLSFPPSSSFSPSLHALMYYFLSPDQEDRPDIYQVAESVHSLHGSPNPIKNVNKLPPPPSIQSLTALMNEAIKNRGKVEERVKSGGVTPCPVVVPLETTVTPRQRPKGTMSLPPSNSSLLPPPKSPKPIEHFDHSTTNSSPHSPHIDKASLSGGGDSFSGSVVEPIPSWNPFESTSSTSNDSEKETKLNMSTNLPQSAEDEDDPFEKAPFDIVKYHHLKTGTQQESDEIVDDELGSVDLFGLAPFSNPFLEFSQTNSSEQVGGIGFTNLSFEEER